MITPSVIYRDVWGLGPASNHYPGSFPRDLLRRINRRWPGKRRCHLFSGSVRDDGAVMVDFNKTMHPSVVADCQQLPFKDGVFDWILLDPPYSEEEAQRLYKCSYCNMLRVMNEAARVCASGGLMLLLHRLIPFHHPKQNAHFMRMVVKAVMGVYTIAGWSNMRVLTVWEKYPALMEDERK